VLGISRADQGSEATPKVGNGDIDRGDSANGIRKTTNDESFAKGVEIDLGAGEKTDGVSPNTGELIATGGVQKELFAPMRGARRSESGKKHCGSAKVGGLGQGVALDRTIAAAIDVGLTGHDKEGRRGFCSEGARNYGTKQRRHLYNKGELMKGGKKGKRRSPQRKAIKFVGRVQIWVKNGGKPGML